MTFSEKIDKLLKDNNIKNLRKLAEEIEIPYTTLWDYYSNPIRLEKANLTYIKKIAKRLNCTVDYLAYNELENPQMTMVGFNLENKTQKELQDQIKRLEVENGVTIELEDNAEITAETILKVHDALNRYRKDLEKFKEMNNRLLPKTGTIIVKK